MKELSKEKIYGIVGTVLFHALLFLLLYLLVMEKPETRKEESFVEQMKPDPEDEAEEKEYLEKVEEMMSEPVQDARSGELSQTAAAEPEPALEPMETPVAVPDADIVSNDKTFTPSDTIQQPKENPLKHNVSNIFGASYGMPGETEDPDPQGSHVVPGKPDANGTKFNLEGRTGISLPYGKISVSTKCEVVVRITVAPDGSVTEAKVSSTGTTTVEDDVRAAACRYAKESKFNKVDSKEIQLGTITYIFDPQ